MNEAAVVFRAEPLTAADLRELRAAARPGGLRVRLSDRPAARRLERLDRLNQRRLLAFGGLRRDHDGPSEVIYALSDAGREMFQRH